MKRHKKQRRLAKLKEKVENNVSGDPSRLYKPTKVGKNEPKDRTTGSKATTYPTWGYSNLETRNTEEYEIMKLLLLS